MVCILPVGDELGASTCPGLEDALRLAFTQQLGALGDPVPTVTQVVVHAQNNGTLPVTLTGTHFAPGAELLIGV